MLHSIEIIYSDKKHIIDFDNKLNRRIWRDVFMNVILARGKGMNMPQLWKWSNPDMNNRQILLEDSIMSVEPRVSIRPIVNRDIDFEDKYDHKGTIEELIESASIMANRIMDSFEE